MTLACCCCCFCSCFCSSSHGAVLEERFTFRITRQPESVVLGPRDNLLIPSSASLVVAVVFLESSTIDVGIRAYPLYQNQKFMYNIHIDIVLNRKKMYASEISSHVHHGNESDASIPLGRFWYTPSTQRTGQQLPKKTCISSREHWLLHGLKTDLATAKRGRTTANNKSNQRLVGSALASRGIQNN